MKVSGVIKIGEVTLPEKSKVQVGGIEISYTSEFTVLEAKDMLELARTVPDVIAEVVGKLKAYDDLFDRAARSDVDEALREAEMARSNQEAS